MKGQPAPLNVSQEKEIIVPIKKARAECWPERGKGAYGDEDCYSGGTRR